MARQNLKGKGDGLGKKIGKANIKDWKDQKLLNAGFFEWMKQEFFRSRDHIKETFKTTEVPDKVLPDKWEIFEEEDPALRAEGVTDEMRKNLEAFGEAMKVDYLHNGLSKEEVHLRREFYGPNKLPEKKRTSDIVKIIMEMTNVFSLLLWIAAALAFLGYGLAPDDMGNLYLAVVIIGVVIITGLFSWYQNRKSDAIMDSFKNLTNSLCTVTRHGEKVQVSAIDLVPGDVVHIKTGDKIPADLRMFISTELEVDEAPLTGESLPVKKKLLCGEKGKEDPLEAHNLAFFSTLCKNGNGVGVVIKTGQDTFMGRIADLASSAEANVTTLQREIDHFIKLIAIIAVSLGVIFFILGLIIQYPIITNFVFALGIIVANVPEGLMSTVTISLAITAKKMLKKNVLVKNLQSVETLGAITCICSDKTGTLTQNKMTVVHLWYDMEIKKVKDNQDSLRIEGSDVPMAIFNTKDDSFEYVRFSAVCGSGGKFMTETPEDFQPLVIEKNKFINSNKKATDEDIANEVKKLKMKYQAEYNKVFENDIDARITDTDASESGILKFFEKTEKIDEIRQRYPQHSVSQGEGVKPIFMPFSSKLKFAYFLRRVPDPRDPDQFTFMIAFKGAPEQLLERCTRYLYQGKEYPMTAEFKAGFKFANKCFALKGERVIGLAYARLDPSKFHPDYPFSTNLEESKDLINGLCFSAIISMEDPPRPGVKEAIAVCKTAGIKVIMVTGDQYLTAASIAHQVGIIEHVDDIPEIIKDRYKLATIEEAEAKSNTIIITGDRLAKEMILDSVLSEDNPKKGQFLRNCLLKRDVVFARTSPEQKLVIVDGCQKLQHVVAVTGDGVNDSPAIKKSDIGIAMGKVGTDVAKDAADILLLDDHFPNIIKGIKQGRVIFDLLKKIIGYCLTSNIPELIPFLGFVVIQFPLPLTTILILCIDLGTDIYPNICFAYEAAEEGLMTKKPRNVKSDKLCTMKLFSWGYIFMGIIECSGCFLTYFAVMNDYGFAPNNLFFFTFNEGVEGGIQDMYNPYDQVFKGNSMGFVSQYADQLGIYGEAFDVYVKNRKRQISWSTDGDISVDLRVFYYTYDNSFWAPCAIDAQGYHYDGPVCYRVEALRHAQGAFLLAVVILQIANAFAWRTKSCTIFRHKFSNHYLNSAFFVEIAMICLLLYCPGVNTAFGCRGILFYHWVPCLMVFITHILWSEITKFLIRNVKKPDGSPGFFYQYFYY
jgi:sodium/potassium-transporting ATPase subunit alpha